MLRSLDTMRLTESYLRTLIKQELRNSLSEAPMDPDRKAAMLAKRRATEQERRAREQARLVQQYENDPRTIRRRELQKIEDEAPPEKYRVKDPGSGAMRRYSLGLEDDHLRMLAAHAVKTYPKIMAFAQQSDPDFMDKFEQNLARIQDSASWSGGRLPADEHIISAIEASLG